MDTILKLVAIEDLRHTPATTIKTLGWRGIMKTLRTGKVVVTNHNEPEAVILSIEEYAAILHALQEAATQANPALEMLRQRFDERLASLQHADAGDRLRAVMRMPTVLGGKVKVGKGH